MVYITLAMLIAQVQIQSNSLLEYVALVLSVVSLFITVLGFLASLKFYRDGMELQAKANDALTKIEEKTQFIQTQVGGMFDKTLEAAIGKRELLSESFEQINEQLEKAKVKVIQESIKEIGAAGEQERNRLTGVVDQQFDLLREKIDSTWESAREITASSNDINTNVVFQVLKTAFERKEEGVTLDHIAAIFKMSINTAIYYTTYLTKNKHLSARRDNKLVVIHKRCSSRSTDSQGDVAVLKIYAMADFGPLSQASL